MGDGLKSLSIKGFKTIKNMDLGLRQVNILIGANGAGKSNLLSFFRLINFMTGSDGGLELYVSRTGGANSLLHLGAEITTVLEANVEFETDAGANEYYMRLVYAAGDTLIFADEGIRFSRNDFPKKAPWNSLGAGHRGTALKERCDAGDKTAKVICHTMKNWRAYQFHNTSETSKMRGKWSRIDNGYLREDAGNLAPFLLTLSEQFPRYYRRIIDTIRLAYPPFDDFEFVQEFDSVLLGWRERNTDYLFGAHQASDGLLRLFALTTLLLQPEEKLPKVILLDEPELGMHPYGITLLADLIKSVATYAQVIVATQSPMLVDHFQPEDIIVVDRLGHESAYKRLNSDDLTNWLDDYTVAELWNKNLLGGRP